MSALAEIVISDADVDFSSVVSRNPSEGSPGRSGNDARRDRTRRPLLGRAGAAAVSRTACAALAPASISASDAAREV